MKVCHLKAFLIPLCFFFWPVLGQASPEDLRTKILTAARGLLERGDISYTFGGSKVGDGAKCDGCNACLEVKNPGPAERLGLCPMCDSCSLDCSHFIKEVYAAAGFNIPYLTTAMMALTATRTLSQIYGLLDIPPEKAKLQPADILVYRGHVVLVERQHANGFVDIIHATGGKDLRGPGLGVQRQRMVMPLTFRGPLLRVLRHKSLEAPKMFRRI